MDVALSLHGRAATALVLYYAAVGLWGLYLGVRNSAPTPGFRGSIAIAVIASIVQGAVGFLVFFFLRPPPDTLTSCTGSLIALAMPLAASLVRDRARAASPRPRPRGASSRGPRDPGHHRNATDVAPLIDEVPIPRPGAAGPAGTRSYFNVAGSGPRFPVAQRAAERFVPG